MSWHPGALETDHGSGRQRAVILVRCDTPDCIGSEAISQAAVTDDGQPNPLKVQKLLVRRGWSWTQPTEGARDYCPACTTTREAVAS